MQTHFFDLYRRLIRIRLVEEAIVQEHPLQQMRCPIHLSLGQEAIAAGAVASLKTSDAILSSHRSHAPYIAAGGNLFAMFAELYGKGNDCCNGRGGSMHLVDLKVGFWASIPIIASALPIATGLAFGFKMQKKTHVSMAFFGEGATEAGAFHESLQYAAIKQLPIIYICENNRLVTCSPYSERRPKNFKIHELAKAYGISSYSGDGNDIFNVHKVCSEAVKHARLGKGASFLEFNTYRYKEHCGPNDDHHLPYRSKEELMLWKKRCPIVLAQNELIKLGISTVELEKIYSEEKNTVDTALKQAQEAPFPCSKTASSHIYA